MAATAPVRLQAYTRDVLITGLLFGVASTAWAQAITQNLTIGFQAAGAGVGPVNLPLSNWASAGIAIFIAIAAFMVLRRRNVRGGRFLGALLAVVAGAAMLGTVGQGAIDEVAAQGPVTIIDLSVSPTVNVGALLPNLTVTAVVSNTTGQSVQLTSITLAPGPYVIFAPTTCAISLVLTPGATCSISLTQLV